MQLKAGKTFKEGPESNLRLGSRQRCTNAKMSASSKRVVALVGTLDVEDVRIGMQGRIMIGCEE